jgi:hypothetical protein
MFTTNPRVIYILGSGHCGSTLLDLLLGAHPQVIGVGEVANIHKYINGKGGNNNICSCRRRFEECGFWQQVLECLSKSVSDVRDFDIHIYMSWKKIFTLSTEERQGFSQRYGAMNKVLFDCIAKVSGKEIIVDSSKQAQRLYFLQHSGMLNLQVIHLIRNGKAVMNSYVRKYGKPLAAIRRWAGVNTAAIFLRRLFRPDQWFQISYERLATEPDITLQEICGFLGIEYDPQMLHFRKHITHNLGGNRMRFRSEERIVPDEKWRRELKRSHAFLFNILAGWLNKFYGY